MVELPIINLIFIPLRHLLLEHALRKLLVSIGHLLHVHRFVLALCVELVLGFINFRVLILVILLQVASHEVVLEVAVAGLAELVLGVEGPLVELSVVAHFEF